MKAIILGAGLGKRLASLTSKMPKVLLKVGIKTLVEHNVHKLHRIGISQIAVVIGHKGEMVRQVLGDSVKYYEQHEQLGTAHAFNCAKAFIDEPYFLGMNGDMFFTDPLIDFIKLNPPAIAVYSSDDTRRFGRVQINDKKLVKVSEKSREEGFGFVNAGVYLFPKQIFNLIQQTPLSPRGEYEITETIQIMIDQGFRIRVYSLKGYWTDIAYLTDLEKAINFDTESQQPIS